MTVQPVEYPNKDTGDTIVNGVVLPKWTLGDGDQGAKVKAGEFADKTIHFHGPFGTGGSVGIRGSNKIDPDEETAADWFYLTDPAGEAITDKTSASGFVIMENTLWISPDCTDGNISTAVECSLLAKKEN